MNKKEQYEKAFESLHFEWKYEILPMLDNYNTIINKVDIDSLERVQIENTNKNILSWNQKVSRLESMYLSFTEKERVDMESPTIMFIQKYNKSDDCIQG